MITLGSSTSNRGLCFHRIRRRRGSKPDSGFSRLYLSASTPLRIHGRPDVAGQLPRHQHGRQRPGLAAAGDPRFRCRNGRDEHDRFLHPGSGGVQTIAPLSPLPALTSPVTIDGTSQPGYDPNNPAPMIELSGQNITGTTAFGLEISGGDSTIEGLIVNRFPSSQIVLDTNGGDIVRGNDLGTDATGTVARATPSTARPTYRTAWPSSPRRTQSAALRPRPGT